MASYKEYFARVWDWYRVTVAKYPVRSPLVALAIGFVLGAWLL